MCVSFVLRFMRSKSRCPTSSSSFWILLAKRRLRDVALLAARAEIARQRHGDHVSELVHFHRRAYVIQGTKYFNYHARGTSIGDAMKTPSPILTTTAAIRRR
jgi:hypothetical protein